MNRRLIAAAISVMVVAVLACAQDNLGAQYAGKILVQRKFVAGSHPVYDVSGTVLSGDLGPWTTSSEIQVRDIRAQGDRLLIEGQRRFLLYDSAGRQFRDVFELLEGAAPEVAQRLIPSFPSEKQMEKFRQQRPVIIEVRRAGGWDEAAVSSAMKQVFLSSDERLSDFVSELWKDFLCKTEASDGRPPCAAPIPVPLPPANPVYKVGSGVTPPHALFTPDPKYAEPARLAHYQGTSVVYMVLGPDGSRVASK